jgi:hypothetical protein
LVIPDRGDRSNIVNVARSTAASRSGNFGSCRNGSEFELEGLDSIVFAKTRLDIGQGSGVRCSVFRNWPDGVSFLNPALPRPISKNRTPDPGTLSDIKTRFSKYYGIQTFKLEFAPIPATAEIA